MAKFCGNCGAAVDNTAKVCGNCGTLLDNINNPSSRIPGVDYVDPEKKAKTTKKAKKMIMLIALFVVVIITVNIVSGFTGYKGTVRKIMNAYETYDIDTIGSISSDVYLYYVSGNEQYAEDYFGYIISENLDRYEEVFGYDYKFNYEIIDAYEMSKYKMENLLDNLSYYDDFDANVIEKVMVIDIEISLKGKNYSETESMQLTLTKEYGSWKLLYLV